MYAPAPSLPTSAPSRTTNRPRTMVETGQPFTSDLATKTNVIAGKQEQTNGSVRA